MKNIFKKNQIIITALAIMIAIAGYLNFSGRNNDDKIADVGSKNVLDYDTYTETQGDNITDGDTVSLQDTKDLLDETALDITTDGESDKTDTAKGTGKEDAAADDTDKTASAKDDKKDEAKTDDTKTASNSDKKSDSEEVAAYDVNDNGEVVTDKKGEETSAPGEAVLVSTTTTPDFFASRKLAREQLRSTNKDELMKIVNSASLSEKAKEDAVNGIIEMTAIAEKENATETLLEAMGFSDVIVTIEGKLVDVVVNAESLNEQDIAKIEDIVKRKTGVKSKDINIAPVVVGD
ncbi:SpoIIIAH-like family protein [Anaerocolumna sp. AGMB13025]|uniref:SpoIIIAH-like family protein n=1 Tax=Anaerocolumna sp. AGMB13025 TaxID=3039116 RepID=UPI00241FCA6C|nr:SpoIIIAH-like family protein [Anaerocolumna sp. AGMB13025]WFR59635.1 SpoIIIAH-like family protein [Anaerocolumna sp. AGMB13025]